MKRFAKHLLKGGKASHAEKIMYATLYRLKNQTEDDPLYVIQKAVEHSQPLFTLKKRRVAGRTRQVPGLLRAKKREGIAVRWILEAAAQRQKSSKGSLPFAECLSAEFLDAFRKEGNVMRKKNELHKTAEANRGFVKSLW